MSEDSNYTIKYREPKYIIDVFRVTQNGVTKVIHDVKAYQDKVINVEAEIPNRWIDKNFVVLDNPYNDEIRFEINEPAVINMIAEGECLAMKGFISSKDIFNAIYGSKFDKFNKELDKEFPTERSR